MKKKILAVFAALAIMTVGSTALAAGSPTAGTTTEDKVAEGQVTVTNVQKPTESAASMATSTTVADTDVTVKAVADTTVDEAVVATKNLVADVKTLGEATGNKDIAAAASNKDATVTATVLSVVNLESTASNKTVTVKNTSIKADKTYVVLHFTNGAWETIPATVTKAGEIQFTVGNFSPFAIVELGVAVKNAGNGTAAPTTGETLPVAVLAMLVCAAGIAVCAKKEEN